MNDMIVWYDWLIQLIDWLKKSAKSYVWLKLFPGVEDFTENTNKSVTQVRF